MHIFKPIGHKLNDKNVSSVVIYFKVYLNLNNSKIHYYTANGKITILHLTNSYNPRLSNYDYYINYCNENKIPYYD
jgi:hypothetical protein